MHRVQRVPATESQGRIHTSTTGVLVFLEVDALPATYSSTCAATTASAVPEPDRLYPRPAGACARPTDRLEYVRLPTPSRALSTRGRSSFGPRLARPRTEPGSSRSTRATAGSSEVCSTASCASEIIAPFPPESELSGTGDTDFLEAVWYRRARPAARPPGPDAASCCTSAPWTTTPPCGRTARRSPGTAAASPLHRPTSPRHRRAGEEVDHRAGPRPQVAAAAGARQAGRSSTPTTTATTPASRASGRRSGWSLVPVTHLRRPRITPDLAELRRSDLVAAALAGEPAGATGCAPSR